MLYFSPEIFHQFHQVWSLLYYLIDPLSVVLFSIRKVRLSNFLSNNELHPTRSKIIQTKGEKVKNVYITILFDNIPFPKKLNLNIFRIRMWFAIFQRGVCLQLVTSTYTKLANVVACLKTAQQVLIGHSFFISWMRTHEKLSSLITAYN